MSLNHAKFERGLGIQCIPSIAIASPSSSPSPSLDLALVNQLESPCHNRAPASELQLPKLSQEQVNWLVGSLSSQGKCKKMVSPLNSLKSVI
jgi:hypothetical protein